jgi:hypothetical protein
LPLAGPALESEDESSVRSLPPVRMLQKPHREVSPRSDKPPNFLALAAFFR